MTSPKGVSDEDDIKPWDSDHTALVHVLWACDWEGLTLDRDCDEIASRIRASKYHRAVVVHAYRAAVSDNSEG